MRSLQELFLTPVSLGETRETREGLASALSHAVSRRGIVEDIVHDGDAEEPAELHAYFASPGTPERRATILFIHGKGGRGAEFRRDAVRALGLGYNVLVPELRAHPPSTGARITYGLREREDLRLLVDAARERHGIRPDRLGIDSCSMGSLVALQIASRTSVAAIWLQAPFANLPAMAAQYLHRASGLPRWLLTVPAGFLVARMAKDAGLDLTALDPVRAAARVTSPVVVIHGEEDVFVRASFAAAIHEALAGEKDLWRVPRCGHCHHPDEPQAIRSCEYLRRWRELFGRHLPSDLLSSKA